MLNIPSLFSIASGDRHTCLELDTHLSPSVLVAERDPDQDLGILLPAVPEQADTLWERYLSLPSTLCCPCGGGAWHAQMCAWDLWGYVWTSERPQGTEKPQTVPCSPTPRRSDTRLSGRKFSSMWKTTNVFSFNHWLSLRKYETHFAQGYLSQHYF